LPPNIILLLVVFQEKTTMKRLAMGIAPYCKFSDKKQQDRAQEKYESDTDCSSHSTSSVGSASSSASVASTLASPHHASRTGSAGRAEYTPDEESILNGWVRRYFGLQQQVVLPAPICDLHSLHPSARLTDGVVVDWRLPGA